MNNPHNADLSGLAKLWGMNHIRIRTLDDFDQFERSENPVLLEIIPDAKQTDLFWADWDRMAPC